MTDLQQWLALLETRHPTEIDLGLERCRVVWERMGSPRPARRLYIVGGTNGKGSTVACICAALGGLGHSYGSYTTPHLLRYNERIQIQGVPASDADLLEAFAAVEQARSETSLTYFEFGTLAAFEVMARAAPEYAVLEVGLGGRLDAVNLLDADCAVITPVALDHQQYLGNDRESIGLEKAGIIRPNTPLICGEARPPDSVLSRAKALAAPMKRLGVEFSARPIVDHILFTCGETTLELPQPVMQGEHQAGNMATAVAAILEILPEAVNEADRLTRALQDVSLPGRLQTLRTAPHVLVDVGHNPLAARVVAHTLERMNPGYCRCVIGMLQDKDVEAVAAVLGSVVDEWYCAGLGGSRAQSGRDISLRIKHAIPTASARVFDSAEGALAGAISDADSLDCILVFGSFQTAAEAIRSLGAAKDAPGRYC